MLLCHSFPPLTCFYNLCILCYLQVEFEFDFVREAESMDRISESLSVAFKDRPPVLTPRSVPGMVTE